MVKGLMGKKTLYDIIGRPDQEESNKLHELLLANGFDYHEEDDYYSLHNQIGLVQVGYYTASQIRDMAGIPWNYEQVRQLSFFDEIPVEEPNPKLSVLEADDQNVIDLLRNKEVFVFDFYPRLEVAEEFEKMKRVLIAMYPIGKLLPNKNQSNERNKGLTKTTNH